MEKLKPRFTNAVVRALKKSNDIDLFALGDKMADEANRSALMVAGHPEADPTEVMKAFDLMTPGETMEMLTQAIIRDLLPASQREANAKAATSDKSAEG